MGLKFLPEGWHTMIDIPNTKWINNTIKDKCNAKWNISHVSAESFFENKHGNMLIVSLSFFPQKEMKAYMF